MKTLFKQIAKVAIIILTLFIFNCEKEDDYFIPITKENELPFTVSKIDSDDILENETLVNQLSEIECQNNTGNEVSSKLVYAEGYDFYVDTDDGNYLESFDGNYHSYSYPIYRVNSSTSNLVENLIFSYNELSNIYDVYMSSYALTSQEREDLANNIFVDLTGKNSIAPLNDFNPEIILNSLVLYVDTDSGTITCYDEIYGTSSSTGAENVIVGFEEVVCPWLIEDDPSGNGSSFPPNYGDGFIPPNGDYSYFDPNAEPPESVTTAPVISTLEKERRKKFLISSLSATQRMWFENQVFEYQTSIFNYLNSQLQQTYDLDNVFDQESVNAVKWIIDFELLPTEPCGMNHDCVQSILTMAQGLRNFHGDEGALMADYFESVVEDLNTFTLGDLQEFYDTARLITKEYNRRMRLLILGAYADSVATIITAAVVGVALPVAIRFLQQIPASWVMLQLNNMIQSVAQLGVQGNQEHVRIVTTSSPVIKAEALFNMLTQNVVSTVTQSNGTIIANMGNGNYITFRTVSSTLFPATIDLNFPSILGETPTVIKFIAP